MKRSKKYTSVASKVDTSKEYSIEEAIKLIPEVSYSKFPGSVEIELLLSLSDKQKKEVIRGPYSLPNHFGKEVKVLVFADSPNLKNAKSADISGGEELVDKVEKGELEYDIIIATPAMMPKIARLGKTIGKKGLMPSPKNGTITNDLEKTIAKFKSGQKNFRATDSGKINAVIGKTDMKAKQLEENYEAFMNAVRIETNKFGTEVISRILLSPTMGPNLKVKIS